MGLESRYPNPKTRYEFTFDLGVLVFFSVFDRELLRYMDFESFLVIIFCLEGLRGKRGNLR